MVRFRANRSLPFQLDLYLVLAIGMLCVLWAAGGASRPDAAGQAVVRFAAWLTLIAALIFGRKPDLRRMWPLGSLLIAIALLPTIQLIPLPPNWWQALPGRDLLLIPGESSIPWRPLTMTPGATRNALAALIVPVAMFAVLAQRDDRTESVLPSILLWMVITAVMLGLFQFSGAPFNNPLLNDTPGEVSSIFANRNHFALFIAIGCVIAPVWCVTARPVSLVRLCCAAGLVLLFLLAIIATGSRAGIVLGLLGVAAGLILAWPRLRQRLAEMHRLALPAFATLLLMVCTVTVALSIVTGRASSIKRLTALDVDGDMRSRAFPTVVEMIKAYMPFGSGFGGFDNIFRAHEPFALLKFTYFNQAHNDYLGIALDGGIPALTVFVAALAWWGLQTFWLWQKKGNDQVMRGRMGSAIILLVLISSLTDYPSRTPLIMATLVIASVWMMRGCQRAA
jgi:O-antigen ligase